MLVIGVDYSGAKTDKNTWISRGLFTDNQLVLETCELISRDNLTLLLGNLVSSTIASLDFPFSVPEKFSQFWNPSAQNMADLWTEAAAITLSEFISFRDQFVKQHGEVKRLGDTFYPECYSCLHKSNPNLVPMTFYGMQMLDELNRAGCFVPPLKNNHRSETVLLEAMPGSGLRAMGLPFKGYKNGSQVYKKRDIILKGLEKHSGLTISNLGQFIDLGMEKHVALDSLIAAVVASLWAQDPAKFRCPPKDPSVNLKHTINLEGWLYTPAFL